MKQPAVLTIMVPVYNEQKTLLKILKSVTTLPIERYEVIVVNDASKDRSAEIITEFKKSFKSKSVSLKVLTHETNRGKGAGIQTALAEAKGEYFVIQDADLEYNPKDIPKLYQYALKNKAKVVYGSRFLGNYKNMPPANYLANKFYNLLLRVLYDTKITDMHTCYKMVETKLFKRFNISSNGFGYAPEVVSNILKRGIPIHEVPISFDGRTKKEGKKINFKDGVDCIYKIFRYRFSSMGGVK